MEKVTPTEHETEKLMSKTTKKSTGIEVDPNLSDSGKLMDGLTPGSRWSDTRPASTSPPRQDSSNTRQSSTNAPLCPLCRRSHTVALLESRPARLGGTEYHYQCDFRAADHPYLWAVVTNFKS